MSALRLGEELLPPLCADEKTQFPWQQSNLHRHGLVLFVVYVVEAGGALWRREEVWARLVAGFGMCAPLTMREDLWRCHLRQLQLTSTGFQLGGVFGKRRGVLLFYIPAVCIVTKERRNGNINLFWLYYDITIFTSEMLFLHNIPMGKNSSINCD